MAGKVELIELSIGGKNYESRIIDYQEPTPGGPKVLLGGKHEVGGKFHLKTYWLPKYSGWMTADAFAELMCDGTNRCCNIHGQRLEHQRTSMSRAGGGTLDLFGCPAEGCDVGLWMHGGILGGGTQSTPATAAVRNLRKAILDSLNAQNVDVRDRLLAVSEAKEGEDFRWRIGSLSEVECNVILGYKVTSGVPEVGEVKRVIRQRAGRRFLDLD